MKKQIMIFMMLLSFKSFSEDYFEKTTIYRLDLHQKGSIKKYGLDSESGNTVELSFESLTMKNKIENGYGIGIETIAKLRSDTLEITNPELLNFNAYYVGKYFLFKNINFTPFISLRAGGFYTLTDDSWQFFLKFMEDIFLEGDEDYFDDLDSNGTMGGFGAIFSIGTGLKIGDFEIEAKFTSSNSIIEEFTDTQKDDSYIFGKNHNRVSLGFAYRFSTKNISYGIENEFYFEERKQENKSQKLPKKIKPLTADEREKSFKEMEEEILMMEESL